MSEKHNVSRRNFIKGAAVGAAAITGATLLPGCGTSDGSASTPDQWDEETDIVVVGFGGAGASAALEAHAAGAEVLIFEKGPVPGGSTALSGQCIYGAGTSVQKALGVEDSVEAMHEYFQQVCDGDPEIVKLVCEKSTEAVEWLIDLGMDVPAEIGMPGITVGGVESLFEDVTPAVPRSHWSSENGSLWSVLQEAVEERGITYYLETPVVELISNGQEIVGVVAEKDGEPWHVKARKGVIIAAGGFSRNEEMLYELVSDTKLTPFTCPTDDGDGIRMAQSMGAGVAFVNGILDVPTWRNPEVPNNFLIAPEYIPGNPPYIVVNLQGNRFVDETTYYEYSNPKILAQPESVGFVITCTDAGREAIVTQDVKSSDTLEGLAQELGVDPEGLVASVEKWNRYCEEESDSEFGRDKLFFPLDTPPYHAGATYPGFAATMGGIKINTRSEVLDALTEEPVRRLYAAGCGAASLGRFYPGCGGQVNEIVVTGRIAGQNAAAEEAWS